jgi:hypothetical protein
MIAFAMRVPSLPSAFSSASQPATTVTWAWRAEGLLDRPIVSGGTSQPGTSEATVVPSVKDGALGRPRVLEAVDLHAHPHKRQDKL